MPIRVVTSGTSAATASWRERRSVSHWPGIWAANIHSPARPPAVASSKAETSASGLFSTAFGTSVAESNSAGSISTVPASVTGSPTAPTFATKQAEARSHCSAFEGDGSIIPRNGLVGLPLHRVDMRLQKRIAISDRVQLFGMFEVFNLFNHANYGSYTQNENSPSYGLPSFSDNPAYQPRMLQLGFRTTF